MDEIELNEKEKCLSRSFIFNRLDPETCRELANLAFIRKFSSGETIFSAGAPGDSMMAVSEGSVRIGVHTPAGRQVVLTEIPKGGVFGEIALLDGGERSADAVAVTNCKLVVLERSRFLPLLKRDVGLSIRLIEALCGQVRRSDERMLELAFLDLPSRLAKAVLRGSEREVAGRVEVSAKLSISQGELANMIGASRENVNRCLRRWQDADLIELKDGWLVIVDRAGLVELAG